MTDATLTSGVTVSITPPNPRVSMAPPTSGVLVVPVAGPAGPLGDGSALTAHIESATPHPAYDDMPSLTLVFENGLI